MVSAWQSAKCKRLLLPIPPWHDGSGNGTKSEKEKLIKYNKCVPLAYMSVKSRTFARNYIHLIILYKRAK